MNNVALAERDRIVNSLRSCEDRAKQLFSLIRRHCPDVSSSSVYSPEKRQTKLRFTEGFTRTTG